MTINRISSGGEQSGFKLLLLSEEKILFLCFDPIYDYYFFITPLFKKLHLCKEVRGTISPEWVAQARAVYPHLQNKRSRTFQLAKTGAGYYFRLPCKSATQTFAGHLTIFYQTGKR